MGTRRMAKYKYVGGKVKFTAGPPCFVSLRVFVLHGVLGEIRL